MVFQVLNDVTQYLESSVSRWIKGYQELTLWTGNTAETPVTAVVIDEMETSLILEVHISDIHQVELDIKITPETVLLQGKPTDSSVIEGYFSPSEFQCLIPLPYPVQTKSCWAEIHEKGVIIQLAKQLKNKPPHQWVKVAASRSSVA